MDGRRILLARPGRSWVRLSRTCIIRSGCTRAWATCRRWSTKAFTLPSRSTLHLWSGALGSLQAPHHGTPASPCSPYHDRRLHSLRSAPMTSMPVTCERRPGLMPVGSGSTLRISRHHRRGPPLSVQTVTLGFEHLNIAVTGAAHRDVGRDLPFCAVHGCGVQQRSSRETSVPLPTTRRYGPGASPGSIRHPHRSTRHRRRPQGADPGPHCNVS